MSGPSRPRLLIVDDEPQILAALRRALRREGYQIVTAETASEALRQLRSERMDLVLSDQKMPDMSGVELLGRVARLQPHAARLLITGWPGSLQRRELDAVGVAGLISKPWDNGALKRALREALGLR